MILTRRGLIGGGGGIAAALACPALLRAAPAVLEIEMIGRNGGAEVWFDPVGLGVEPGTTIRWINRDAGNSHTATAYHPAIGDRQRRIPSRAEPWDSGYLLPGESFSVMLTAVGTYDYYCMPHEMAGMVGRIVVGEATAEPLSGTGEPPPEVALAAFPSVDRIMAEGRVGLLDEKAAPPGGGV